MSTVAVTRTIDAPVATVWDVCTDLADRGRWLTGVTRVEVRMPGSFGAGTIWRETRLTDHGGEVTEEFRVGACVPSEHFTVHSPGVGASYFMEYGFVSMSIGRTVVTVVQHGSPTSTRGRLLALLFGGLAAETAEGALRRDLNDLAAACSRSPAP